MPPNTRALAISDVAAEKLVKLRVPGRTSEVVLNAVSSPKASARVNAAAPLTVEWPDGYSGYAGVPDGNTSSKGSQAGSGPTAPLPVRIAVIVRQNTYRYLPSQQAIPASAMDTFSTANNRAFAVRESPALLRAVRQFDSSKAPYCRSRTQPGPFDRNSAPIHSALPSCLLH
jgi:hypothetical protein